MYPDSPSRGNQDNQGNQGDQVDHDINDMMSQDIISQEIMGDFPSHIADLGEPSLFPVLPISINMHLSNSSQSASMLSPSHSVHSRSLYLPSPSIELSPGPKHPLTYGARRGDVDDHYKVQSVASGELKDHEYLECSHDSRDNEREITWSPPAGSPAPAPPSPNGTFSMEIHSDIMKNGEFTAWPTELMYAWTVAQIPPQTNPVHQ